MKLWSHKATLRIKMLERRLTLDRGRRLFGRGGTSAISAPHIPLDAATTCDAVAPSGVRDSGYPTALPRVRACPLTCLGDAAEIDGGGESRFACQMPLDYGNRQLLRKWWEWDYLARSAEQLGILDGDATGIGLGAGDEPLIFYFARNARKIIATDLYSGSASWREARFDGAEAVLRSSPLSFPRERVEVRNADMRSLGVPDGSMDFAWSCSSIEHVSTLHDLLAVFDELSRVLKVGGYALVTTEYCLTQPPYLLGGVNAWDAALLAALVEGLGAFEFIGPTDLSYNFAHPANAPKPRRYLPAGLTRTPWTRVEPAFRWGQMANLVGLSAVAPIAFVLRRREGKNARWQDLKIDADVRRYSDAVADLRGGRAREAVLRLRPLIDDGPARTTLQWYHHAFRFFIEALAIDSAHAWQQITAEIARFMRHLPDGALQDADCLDLVGYLLDEAGQYDTAAHVYRLAMHSPSTDQDHVVKLAFDYCRVMSRAGRFEQAVGDFVAVLADMAANGHSAAELARPIEAARKRCGLKHKQLRQLHEALARNLDESATAIRTAADKCRQLI